MCTSVQSSFRSTTNLLLHIASSVGGNLFKSLIWMVGIHCPPGYGLGWEHPPALPATGGGDGGPGLVYKDWTAVWGSFGVVQHLQILKSGLNPEKAPVSGVRFHFVDLGFSLPASLPMVFTHSWCLSICPLGNTTSLSSHHQGAHRCLCNYSGDMEKDKKGSC